MCFRPCDAVSSIICHVETSLTSNVTVSPSRTLRTGCETDPTCSERSRALSHDALSGRSFLASALRSLVVVLQVTAEDVPLFASFLLPLLPVIDLLLAVEADPELHVEPRLVLALLCEIVL